MFERELNSAPGSYRKGKTAFSALLSWQAAAVLATLLVCSALLPAADKKGKNAPAAPDPATQRVGVDISLLVWPNPPAIARIRFLDMYTGEKVDWDALAQKPKKPKQTWMDRMAGAQPAADQKIKIPFQLIRVYGVAVDSKGFIYAADEGVDAIFIFNPETKDVQLIRNGHEGRFGLINGLAIDDNDRLFVTDGKLHKVMVFNAKHEQEGSFGADALIRPGGIAIDKENRFVYVVDAEADQVVVFDADSYKLLRRIGVSGKKHTLTAPGTFSLPTNVAVSNDGIVYVTDTLNNRVESFDADGNFIREFGKIGDGPGRFSRPKGVAVDCDGHVWVVDGVLQRVQVFDSEGRLLIYFGGQGPLPGQFQEAYGIAIDKQNRVVTSELYPGRVQVFRYVTDAEAEQEKKKRAAEGENPVAPKASAQSATAAPKDSAPATVSTAASH
jgi:DNA-binding beta-propeller fold protein YncE